MSIIRQISSARTDGIGSGRIEASRGWGSMKPTQTLKGGKLLVSQGMDNAVKLATDFFNFLIFFN